VIDDITFAGEMTILQDRFGRRDITSETLARYYDYLSPRMNTETFTVAAREIFNRDTFWPSPLRFLEVLKGNPKALADDAWSRLIAAASKGAHPLLSDIEERALSAVGGFREIMYAEGNYKQDQLRKQFVGAYAREAEGQLERVSHPELPL
jgi:hypothetical protein